MYSSKYFVVILYLKTGFENLAITLSNINRLTNIVTIINGINLVANLILKFSLYLDM